MDLSSLFSALMLTVLLVLVALLLISLVLLQNVNSLPNWKRYPSEMYFVDGVTGEKHPFPELSDAPSVTLSVIVPAYNEEARLRPMMDDCLDYLASRSKKEPGFKYEIIIVSDGSTDETEDVAMEYVRKLECDKIRLLNLEKNRGKGGAVRLGVFSARGEYILFADADGATKFSDIDKLFTAMRPLNPVGIVCGSRAHMEEEAIANRSVFRTILMRGFHFFVWLFTVRGIRDTQCGFKLFTREAARMVFPSLHIERWAFDVELLYIAQKLKIPIEEVAVTWTEIEGSKVTPVISWIQMGIDLYAIWLRYFTGRWQLKEIKKGN